MTRRDVIKEHDALGREEQELIAQTRGPAQAIRDAQDAVRAAESDIVAAEAEAMRGRPDRRENARHAKQEAERALEAATIRQAASVEAITSVRIQRGELVRSELTEHFLPSARAGDTRVKEIAKEILSDFARLRSAVTDAAVAIDRLRARDRETGEAPVPVGGVDRATLRFDAVEVERWLMVAADKGLKWPNDLDAETGAPIDHRSQLVAAGII